MLRFARTARVHGFTRAASLAFVGLLASGTARAQGSWDPWFPTTEVFVHQIHIPSDEIEIWAYSGFSAWLWPNFTTTPNLTHATFCAGHAQIGSGPGIGNSLVMGGLFVNSVSIFDITTKSWSAAPAMAGQRFYPTATTLPNGQVLVTGGTGTGADIPEVYDPATNSWTSLTNAQLAIGIYPFMHVMPNGKLFFSGPSTFTGTLDVAAQAWTFVASSSNDGASSVMYEPGKIMKCGGFASANKVTETIDLNVGSPSWNVVGNMAFERHDHHLTILPDGTVFVAGGHDSNDVPILAGEIFTPSTGTWATMANMAIPRQYHSTSTLLRDGRVIVAGGDGYASAQIFNPPYLNAADARPVINPGTPTQITYNQTFGMKTPHPNSVARITLLRLGSETHSFDHDQRFNELSFTFGPIALPVPPNSGPGIQILNVTAPANANLAPPGNYMIFLVDSQGRPSVGEYITLQ